MFKRPTTSLAIFWILFGSTIAVRADISIHNINEIPYFGATTEITNFFARADVPVEVLHLKNLNTNNFVLCAFPYSGVDTIDVFYFVKYGEGWKLKMLYFCLQPKSRHLEATIENSDKIVLRAKQQELLRITVDPFLNEK
jgi:hypothetical protein